MGGDCDQAGDYNRYVPENGPHILERFFGKLYRMLDGPVTWFRGKGLPMLECCH